MIPMRASIPIAQILLAWAMVQGETLDLAQAQRQLFEKNTDIAIAQLEKKQAESQWMESKAARHPSLDVMGSYSVLSEKNHLELSLPVGGPQGLSVSRDLGDYDRWETGIDLTYPIFTGFARERNIEAQARLLASAQARESAIRNQASLRLAGLYFAWQAAKASLDFQEAQCAFAKSQLAVAEAQAKQGVATDRAVLAARSKWLAAENDKLVATNQVDSLQTEAAQFLKQSDDFVWSPSSKPLSMPESLSLNEISAGNGHDLRPELKSLDQQKAALEAKEKALQGQNWPTLGAMAGWRYANPGLNLAGTEPMGYGLAGLQVKWNLWDGGKGRNQRAQLREKREQIELEMGRWRDEWHKTSTIAARQYSRWRNQGATAQSALEAATKSLSDTRNSLLQGLATPTDTLETFAQAARARMLVQQSQAMQALTYCQWRFAKGDTLSFQP